MRFTENPQHDTSKVLRLPRKMTMDTSKVLRLPRKLQHIFWKRRKSIAPATQNDFRHVPEHVWMSRSATPATRNEATRRLKTPKRTTPAELPIGTAIWSSRGRLRPWTQRLANTPSTPRPPEWNGNPCYAFGKEIYIYKRHNVCRRRTKPIYKRHFVKYVWVHTTTFHLQHDPTLVISLQTASLTEPTVQHIPNLKPSQRRLFATSPIDTATPQENQRLETRHAGAKQRAFRARLPPILIFSTCYQTGWNVPKCHACHAKQHDNLLGNIRKGHVFQLPP